MLDEIDPTQKTLIRFRKQVKTLTKFLADDLYNPYYLENFDNFENDILEFQKLILQDVFGIMT
jgi:hypothetical protein